MNQLLKAADMVLLDDNFASIVQALEEGWGIAIELLLILGIDYTPWGNVLFGTAPIPARVWLFAVPLALGMLVLEEVRKRLVRGRWPTSR